MSTLLQSKWFQKVSFAAVLALSANSANAFLEGIATKIATDAMGKVLDTAGDAMDSAIPDDIVPYPKSVTGDTKAEKAIVKTLNSDGRLAPIVWYKAYMAEDDFSYQYSYGNVVGRWTLVKAVRLKNGKCISDEITMYQQKAGTGFSKKWSFRGFEPGHNVHDMAECKKHIPNL